MNELEAAADYLVPHLRSMAMEGRLVVTWAQIHDLLSEHANTPISAVAMVLCSRGLLKARERQAPAAGPRFLVIVRDGSGPGSWDIQPAVLGIPDPVHPVLKLASELRLSGNQLRAVQMMVETNCEATYDDLGKEFDWNNPKDDWGKLLQQLKRKYKNHGWHFSTNDRKPTFERITSAKSGG